MGLTLALRRNAPPVRNRRLPTLLGFEAHARILDKLIATAHVGLAYGEPARAGRTTIVPIGAVAYGIGWGGGGGSAKVKVRGEDSYGAGGGGGGGVRVTPLAYLEIAPNGRTRLHPVLDWTAIAVALIAALVPTVGVRALAAVKRVVMRRRHS